jgi:hypothetical protein
MSAGEDLIRRAQENVKGQPVEIPDSFGERLDHEEESIVLDRGRYRGKGTYKAEKDGREEHRIAHLFWGANDDPVWLSSYSRLDQEMERECPVIGARISIYRGANYKTKYGTDGYTFGVASEPCSDPLPDDEAELAARQEFGY